MGGAEALPYFFRRGYNVIEIGLYNCIGIDGA